MKKMFIHCDGGFGNRFLVLLSGLHLAKVTGLLPKIIWPSNNWCGAEFGDLFENDFDLVDFKLATFFIENKTTNIIHENQFNQNLESTHPDSFTLDGILNYINQSSDDIFYFHNTIPRYINTDLIKKHILPLVVFKKHLYSTAESTIKNAVGSDDFIGVHIRKTDFVPTLNDNHLYDLIKQNPKQSFFVCSDDAAIEKKFLTLENVFVHDKKNYVEKLVDGHWNSDIRDSNGNLWSMNVNRPKNSVLEAIIDLIILSKSVILETDLRSSFLRIAYLLQK